MSFPAWFLQRQDWDVGMKCFEWMKAHSKFAGLAYSKIRNRLLGT